MDAPVAAVAAAASMPQDPHEVIAGLLLLKRVFRVTAYDNPSHRSSCCFSFQYPPHAKAGPVVIPDSLSDRLANHDANQLVYT